MAIYRNMVLTRKFSVSKVNNNSRAACSDWRNSLHAGDSQSLHVKLSGLLKNKTTMWHLILLTVHRWVPGSPKTAKTNDTIYLHDNKVNIQIKSWDHNIIM